MDKREIYKRAIARLTSLRKNLDMSMIHEKYVYEYHKIIETLTESGINIDEFTIPDAELKQAWASSSYETGEVEYEDYKEIENAYFLYKLDAIINYLKIE